MKKLFIIGLNQKNGQRFNKLLLHMVTIHNVFQKETFQALVPSVETYPGYQSQQNNTFHLNLRLWYTR